MRPSIYTPLEVGQWTDHDTKLSPLQIGGSSIKILMANPTFFVARDSTSSSRIPFLFRRLKQDANADSEGEGITASSLSSHNFPYRRFEHQQQPLPLHLSFGFNSDFTNSSDAPLIQLSRNSVAVNPLLSVLTYTQSYSHEQFISPRVSFVKIVNHYHRSTARKKRHPLSTDSDDNGDADGNGRIQNNEVQILQTPYCEDFLSYIDFYGLGKKQEVGLGNKEIIPSSLPQSTSISLSDAETPLSLTSQPMASVPKIQYRKGNNPSTQIQRNIVPTTSKILNGLTHSLILDDYFMDNHRPPLSYLKSPGNEYVLSFHEPVPGKIEVDGICMDKSPLSFIKSPRQDAEIEMCSLDGAEIGETTEMHDSNLKDRSNPPHAEDRASETWIYNETTKIHVISSSSMSDVVLLPKQELSSTEFPRVEGNGDSLFKRSVKKASRRISALKDKKRMRKAALNSLDIIQQEAASAARAMDSTEKALVEKMEELRGALSAQSNAIMNSPSDTSDEVSSSPASDWEIYEQLKQPSAQSDSEHENLDQNEELPEIISFDVKSSEKSTVSTRPDLNKQGTIPLTPLSPSLKYATASVPRTGTQTTPPPSAISSATEDSAKSAPFNFSDLKQILIWFLIMVQIQNFVIKHREKRKRRKWMSRVKAYDEAEEQRIQAEMEIARRNRLEARLVAEREVARIKEEEDERIYAQQEADRRLIEEQAEKLRDREKDLLKAEEMVARLVAKERKYMTTKREKRRKTTRDYAKRKAHQDELMKAQREAIIRAQIEEETERRISVDVRLRRNSSSPKRRRNNLPKNALTKYDNRFPLQSATQSEKDWDSFPCSPISEDLSDVNSLDIEAFTDAIAMKAAEDAHNRASLELGWEEIRQGLIPRKETCNDSESDTSTRSCFDRKISDKSNRLCNGGGGSSSVGSSLVGESYVSSADESVIKNRVEPIVESGDETLSINSRGNVNVKVGLSPNEDGHSKALGQALLKLKAAECQRRKIEAERTGHSNPQTVECFWTDKETRIFDVKDETNVPKFADIQSLSISPSEKDRTFDMRPLTEIRRSPKKKSKGKAMDMSAGNEGFWDNRTVDL